MRSSLSALLLMFGLVIGCLVSFADEADSLQAQDQKAVQGTWHPDGKKVISFVIQGATIKFIEPNGVVALTGIFKLDPAKSPKAIDITITGTLMDELKFNGKVALGIYEIVDADTWKWCATDPGKGQRPTAFERKNFADTVLMKRAK